MISSANILSILLVLTVSWNSRCSYHPPIVFCNLLLNNMKRFGPKVLEHQLHGLRYPLPQLLSRIIHTILQLQMISQEK